MPIIKIASIGECMVEFSQHKSRIYHQSFAGDTLNTAIYLQRSLREHPVEVSYVTALGDDQISRDILNFMSQQKLDCSLVRIIDGKQPGLYTINLGKDGERTFSYWRNDSAARQLMSKGLLPAYKTLLTREYNVIYFTGITLAILDPVSRNALLDLLSEARQKGTQIAFDSNYRSSLWESPAVARATMDDAFELTDTALITHDDEQILHGNDTPETTLHRIKEKGVSEIVVKNGADGCLVSSPAFHGKVLPPFVEQVVDTTSAGDSFNAGYLASRLKGQSPYNAAIFAHSLASQVIQHKGAIISPEFCPVLN